MMQFDLIPFDPFLPEHATFYVELMQEAGSTLWDDRHRDPIIGLQDIRRLYIPVQPRHFIGVIDGVFTGFIGALVDTQDIAYIEAAILKEYQRFYPARRFLLQFVKHLFGLKVYKIRARIPVFNKAAEKICRSVGFRREGISLREVIFNGERRAILELALFPEYIKESTSRERK